VDDENLVVEDLVNDTPWLENGFEVAGYSTNSQIAVTEIIAKKPDAVFTDLRMPALDGIELIKRVRAADVDTEFVILSAFRDFDAATEFFHDLRGFRYIEKPLDKDGAALELELLSRMLAEKYHKTPTTQFVPSQSKGFDDLVAYVIENFSAKHTLKSLSRTFNMSPNYICSLFAKHYDSTLTIFVTSLRMQKASELLVQTDTPLKEIALFCGFSVYRNFGRVFKEYYGKSPSDYREDQG
jgi:YesN/AraC family two-component response regulator